MGRFEGLGCLGWGGGGHTHKLSHFKRGTSQSWGGEGAVRVGGPRHVNNPESDPSQPANVPAALPPTPSLPQKIKNKIKYNKKLTEAVQEMNVLMNECFKCLFVLVACVI